MQFGSSTLAWFALFVAPFCSANMEAKEIAKETQAAQNTESAEFYGRRFGGHFGRWGGPWYGGYGGYGYGFASPYMYNPYLYPPY